MSAYYVLTQTVTDKERYQKAYVAATWPFLTKYGAEIVAVSMEAEVLQGDPPKGIIILRFPSDEAVRSFVNDPDYQQIKQIRMETTTRGGALLVPEFKMQRG